MHKKVLLLVFLVSITQSVFSKSLFGLTISPGPHPGTCTDDFTKYSADYENIDDLFNATKQSSIASHIEGYNQNSAAIVDLRLGNSSAKLSYTKNNSDLSFTMKGCSGVEKNFTGRSRTANENSFRNYLNKQSTIDKINNCLKNQNNSIVIDFPPNRGDFFKPVSENGLEKFHVGLVVGYSSTGKLNSSILTLPLSYTHYFEEKGRTLKVSTPISYLDINGSKAYKTSLGFIYTRPINERWTIIPATRLGVTISRDMGIAATLASAYLTNRYEFPYQNKNIILANMVGAMKTLDIKIGGYKKKYKLSNQVIKNGISVEFPQSFNMFGGKTSIQASLANTHYFGDKMKVNNYTDIAVSFGTRRKVGNKDNIQDSLQLGFTYTVGNHDYKGGRINFGYEF